YDSEFDVGLSAITAAVSLSADRAVVRTFSASIDGGGSVTASGTVPFEGSGLDLDISGSAPLSLANRFVAERGAQLIGTANLDASVSGSLSDPQFSGQVSVAGGEYVDPVLNLRLTDIAGSASLSG